jgi:hypothetical protein
MANRFIKVFLSLAECLGSCRNSISQHCTPHGQTIELVEETTIQGVLVVSPPPPCVQRVAEVLVEHFPRGVP